jgi:hypothetical protein
LTSVAEQLGELEAVLEAELRRAELIANELERLDEGTEESHVTASV